ncbi:Nn.00g115510.m01.CDS01 [Neocucurbitaria sp. VM-36]
MDARNLIACQPCAKAKAKAKAKCDKKLPTCSRCLYKRLKCEQRSPRRYVENLDFAQDQFNTVIPHHPSVTSPAKYNQVMINDALHSNPTVGPTTGYDQMPTIENLQWRPEPFLNASPCPGDLNMNSMNPDLQHIDTLMDCDFSWNQFEETLPLTQEALAQPATNSLLSETHSMGMYFPHQPETVQRAVALPGYLTRNFRVFDAIPEAVSRSIHGSVASIFKS